MTLRRVQHCGDEEPHEPHVGRWAHHLMQGGPYCDGTPELLARQLEREVNPPPGPPSPPKPVEWNAPRALCDEPTGVTTRSAVMGDIDVEATEYLARLTADKALSPNVRRLSEDTLALTAELARLRSVVGGVEALAEKWDAKAATAERSAQARVGLSDHSDLKVYASIKRNAARRLRSVLSDTRQEPQ